MESGIGRLPNFLASRHGFEIGVVSRAVFFGLRQIDYAMREFSAHSGKPIVSPRGKTALATTSAVGCASPTSSLAKEPLRRAINFGSSPASIIRTHIIERGVRLTGPHTFDKGRDGVVMFPRLFCRNAKYCSCNCLGQIRHGNFAIQMQSSLPAWRLAWRASALAMPDQPSRASEQRRF